MLFLRNCHQQLLRKSRLADLRLIDSCMVAWGGIEPPLYVDDKST